VLVLDTSAFIMGFNPSKAEEAYSVKAVEEELSEGTMPQLRFRMFSDKGVLTVLPPSLRAERIIEEASSRAGESGYLSKADRKVLALAMVESLLLLATTMPSRILRIIFRSATVRLRTME
jgi:rRNA maturation endonuclease Nob1